MLPRMRILLTGAAGFIGHAVARRLLADGATLVGIDNLSSYYDVALKEARLADLQGRAGWSFRQLACEDRAAMQALFADGDFDRVVHLAAQAGVRYSLENPYAYIDANLNGFITILEGCRQTKVGHLVYASSSSVYGLNGSLPFSVHDNVDHPVSLYAATKKANELMAHSYSHLYRIPTTGLRFFTVYGPWGRPDMAPCIFARHMLAGEPIPVFNHGRMQRDFTYIDDVVEGVVRVCEHLPTPDPAWDPLRPDSATSPAPYRLYNIGNHQPVELETFITCLEQAFGVQARRDYRPLQPGDVVATAAQVDALSAAVGFAPATPLAEGVMRFAVWYRDFYGV